MKNVIIRLENPKDYRAVEELTRAAFSNPERIERSKIGCPMEHHMVHCLREKDGIMDLNFVAEMDGTIVGHIIYSHAHILQADGTKVNVLDFGPISVLPKLQKMGIGSALINHSIQEAKKLNYGAILFFGHPEYYTRFGFVQAKCFNITDCDGENYPSFMAMELKEGYLKNGAGKFIEADIYNDDLNREQAKEFDLTFRTEKENCNMEKPEMTAADAVEIIKLIEQNGIEVYIDGGWGVDALLGRQTRKHDDLDIALPHKFVPKLREIFEVRGYKDVPRDDTRECNFVLGDDNGRLIDVHSYTFDENGNNIFGVAYEPRHLTGTGAINGHPVKCIPPEVAVEFHTGYEVDENDYLDVKALCEQFGISVPSIYEKFERK